MVKTMQTQMLTKHLLIHICLSQWAWLSHNNL